MSATTRRPLPALAFILVLFILAAIVWWRVLHRSEDAAGTTVAVTTCATGTPMTFPTPAKVTVTVLNGADRDQLATTVSKQLKARGFSVGTPSDTTSLASVAEIRFGTDNKAAATLLAYYVHGSTLVQEKRSDATIDLVLGAKYKALASALAVKVSLAGAKKPCK